MQLSDPNNPNERKKLIAAAVLGIVAIVVLGYVFFGGGSSKTPTNRTGTTGAPKASPTPARIARDTNINESAAVYQPIVYNGYAPPATEATRNIFAYYEPPPPPVKIVIPPTPTPTPTPPLTASSLAPSSVYARTADFSLQVMGDKFSPIVHITIDGRDLPTRFVSSQQVATTIPSTLITNPGVRQVVVRSNDGKLYSNTIMLNVTPPPDPNSNYSYVGIIGKPRGNDTAVLQDKGNKELMNVQRGDVLGGRFRVNSISEREVVLFDTTLKIRHTLSFTAEKSPNQPSRPPVRTSVDEPL